ncbi:hypothetical protein AMD26_012415 [Deinococcus sp. UR1]|nr:hypothetical protein AMD26_012415 [Deinococcus sp. UR1]
MRGDRPGGLGAVHGLVGQFQQRLRVGGPGDADQAEAHADPQARGHVQPVREFQGDLAGAGVGVRAGQQQRELVPAVTGENLAGTQQGQEPLRDEAQHGVADRVTQRVVDGLEAVEVQQAHHPRLPRPGSAARRGQFPLERAAVGQFGQRVGQRECLEVPQRQPQPQFGLREFRELREDLEILRAEVTRTGVQHA